MNTEPGKGTNQKEQGEYQLPPFLEFAKALDKMDNPKDTFTFGKIEFKIGDSVYGTWVSCDGKCYWQEGVIIGNDITGLWVQTQPDGGITEVKRFVFLNKRIPPTASEPSEGEGEHICPRDHKPCEQDCEHFCFNAGHAVLKEKVKPAKPVQGVEIPVIEVIEEWADAKGGSIYGYTQSLIEGAKYGYSLAQSALASTEAKLKLDSETIGHLSKTVLDITKVSVEREKHLKSTEAKLREAEARAEKLMTLLEEQYIDKVTGYFERAGFRSDTAKKKADTAWQQFRESKIDNV